MNTRKPIRLEGFDYSQNGVYFVTVCVKDRMPVLSKVPEKPVGASIARPKKEEICKPELTEVGVITERAIQNIPERYDGVAVDNYVVMPNHIHLLIRIDREGGRAMLAPTADIPQIVQQLKGIITKRCGRAIWQKSFYDHVIRDEQDYLDIWAYIENNPEKWVEDKMYVKD